MTEEYFETGMKKGRGRAQRSLDLIQAMYKIAEEGQPITGRGVGYKLFSRNLIPSMGRNDMQTVYRLLKEAREEGTIPWAWIVDETRALEKVATWDDPADFVDTVSRSYRRDFWQQQPERVQVWSEKGTIRGVLQPALDEYAVGFMPTILNDVSQDDDSHPSDDSLSRGLRPLRTVDVGARYPGADRPLRRQSHFDRSRYFAATTLRWAGSPPSTSRTRS